MPVKDDGDYEGVNRAVKLEKNILGGRRSIAGDSPRCALRTRSRRTLPELHSRQFLEALSAGGECRGGNRCARADRCRSTARNLCRLDSRVQRDSLCASARGRIAVGGASTGGPLAGRERGKSARKCLHATRGGP